MNNETILSTYRGIGWNSYENVEVTTKDEYTTVTITDTKPGAKIRKKELRFRNVGELNENSSIQMDITAYGKQTRSISFHIPYCMAELFISQLSKIKV